MFEHQPPMTRHAAVATALVLAFMSTGGLAQEPIAARPDVPAGARNDRAPLDPTVQQQGFATYVTGGVGSVAAAQVSALGRDMSLRLVFALHGGEYVADVDVTITDRSGAKVFEIDGADPLLYVQLPPGRYDVTVTPSRGEAQRRTVMVPAKGQRSESFLWRDAG